MKREFIVYYLRQTNISQNEDYADYRELLEEVEFPSRFPLIGLAADRVKELIDSNSKLTVLEVFSM